MTTTANYIIKAVVGGDTYVFQYDEAMDAWEAMEQFWHEDYPEVIINLQGSEMFPISVYAMENGKALREYPFTFNAAIFHAFYDKGHKADGIYTLDEFDRDIRRNVNVIQASVSGEGLAVSENNGQCSTLNAQFDKNDVTSFFYYMWNKWCEEECKKTFAGGDYNHFWNKWCEAYDTMKGPRGAAELFYMMLSKSNRDKLVKRALECYEEEREIVEH